MKHLFQKGYIPWNKGKKMSLKKIGIKTNRIPKSAFKKQNKARLRNKCDKLLQEIGRLIYKKCLVCGRPMSCLHHYFPKSVAGNLRYHWENLIPLCASCHFRHHASQTPEIQNEINRIKGEEWLESLKVIKKQFVKCDTIGYYKTKCEELQLILNKL